MRATLKLLADKPRSSSSAVCMLMMPTLVCGAIRPDNRPPPMMGIARVVGADADCAAEEHFGLAADADREESGILEEERPLFGEEQVEAIEIDLLGIDFDLGEVGVVGRIERQAWRQAVFHIHTEIAVFLRSATAGRVPSCLLIPRRYGVSCRLRCAGIARPDNVPASDNRFRSYCRGSGAQYAVSLRRRMLR